MKSKLEKLLTKCSEDDLETMTSHVIYGYLKKMAVTYPNATSCELLDSIVKAYPELVK